VPVFVPGGDLTAGMEWIKYLRDKGVFVSGVAYPVIPRHHMLFRMVPTASHLDSDIDKTLDAFRALRDDKGLRLDADWSAVEHLYGVN
jgi:glycine C-acetyltransferase